MWKRQMIPGVVKRVISDDEFFERLRRRFRMKSFNLPVNLKPL